MSDVEVETQDAGEESEGVYVGVDPDYQNSAYPVTEPGPLDEDKEIIIQNTEDCAVAAPGAWQDYYPVKESGDAAPSTGEYIVTYGNAGANYEFLIQNEDNSPVTGKSVTWKFGDGETATADSATPATHSYAKKGTYAVVAAIGGSNVADTEVEVAEAAPKAGGFSMEGLDEEEDLDAMTLTELRARAGELNISGRSSMDHDELVDAIAAAEA